MDSRYEPKSEFLRRVIENVQMLDPPDDTNPNFQLLIQHARDSDTSNRDWAVFILAQLEVDSEQARSVLLFASADEDMYVRGEAIAGLAKLSPQDALPLIRRELKGQSVSIPLLDAVMNAPNSSFVSDLLCFSQPSGDTHFDAVVLEAIEVCKKANSNNLGD